ncbi:Cullin-domain-containing protein [Auriculariales sp. MPI-PUGE-AT-0066]|nr:Cullin-domain-containing protein [Auriculariales sp. MPI-PUGE-AT-0066]
MASVQRGPKGKAKITAPKAKTTPHTETWNQLANAIKEIHNHNAINLSFEAVYRYAYTLVIYKHGEMLYGGVKGLIRDNLDKLAREQIVVQFPTGATEDPMQQASEGDRLLRAVNKVWEDHCQNMNKLKAVLAYMDRSYSEQAGLLQTYDVGLKLFLERIMHSSQLPIQRHLVNSILNQIRVDREGYTIHQSIVKECVAVFLTLEDDLGKAIYHKDLEQPFLGESRIYFKTEGESLTRTIGVAEYLHKVEARFTSEEHLVNFMMSFATWDALREILEKHLITDQINFMLSGLEAMIDHDNMDALARLFRLMLKVPDGMPALRRSLKVSITQRGRRINDGSSQLSQTVAGDEAGDVDMQDAAVKGKGKEKETPANQALSAAHAWVEDVLSLKDKFDRIHSIAFGTDITVQGAMVEAFESFIHVNSKAPEFISLFIDENLKKGLKGKTDIEIDVVLDKTITLFRFISEKDVFERYYKAHLAKRLLHGRSVSEDAERGMLAKLKVECGFQFTQKLEGMFNDIKLSAESNRLYKNYISSSGGQPIEMGVTVMTSTFWPTLHSDTSCSLPTEMAAAMTSFQQFYLSRHSGRRLVWQPSLGNVDVRVQFKSRSHDVNVSTLAVVILMLFADVEDDTRLSYEQIRAATSISDVELKRNLQSLACAKYKILRKHPPGREIADEDDFSFNLSFTCPLQRFKIATISARVETSEESKETRAHIEEERRHQTEACIVRIMKDRKTMQHNTLVHEVTRQLSTRFQPNPNDIKKRIESLIEREYLARSPTDKRSYTYLA